MMIEQRLGVSLRPALTPAVSRKRERGFQRGTGVSPTTSLRTYAANVSIPTHTAFYAMPVEEQGRTHCAPDMQSLLIEVTRSC